MHPHRCAGIIGILTHNGLVAVLVFCQNIPKMYYSVKLRDLGGSQPRTWADRASELAQNIKEITVSTCASDLHVKLDVVRQDVSTAAL
jgi:hypothetical protein